MAVSWTALDPAQEAPRSGTPTDARARLVVMTDLGRELVALSAPVVREVEGAWGRHLGESRTRELRRALEALREITDPFA
ncbi:MAG: hypothetical protein AVDCRST_MAG61-2913 [uncultured Friedmanniella sp.]|uniref:HTH marR-type domain-containing protein n=1 Tax=uncultured Friedmanniella sp. TaxID=335381 RepID=A0A6J4LAB8_9ACTN|nr:MAG: hypothetical protein AVDCRST_MAG61-2913 [uncultured Friedmanniella sp.]